MFFKKSYLFLPLLFLVACSEPPKPPQMPPQLVTILTAKAEDIKLSFKYPAVLTSDEDVILRAKVSGQIVQKLFTEGDKVLKDQVLFQIEPDKYKAALDIAQAALLVAEADFENAKKDYSRNQVLIEKQAISQKEYDASLALFNSSKASVESAKAQVANAKLDLDYASVRAPFNGIVGDALINVGDYVNAGTTELVRVTNLNPIFADFYISDVEKLNFNRQLSGGSWEIQNVDVKINVLGEDIIGKLYFVDSVIDEKSGSVKAKAIFDNNNTKLLPGVFTNITTDGFMQKGGFKIPQVALLQDQKNTFVYTVVDGKVTKNVVSIVYQTNDFVVVDKGLKEGDKVILDNFKKIRPGAAVQEVGSK